MASITAVSGSKPREVGRQYTVILGQVRSAPNFVSRRLPQIAMLETEQSQRCERRPDWYVLRYEFEGGMCMYTCMP